MRAGPPAERVELPMAIAEGLVMCRVWPRAVMRWGVNTAAGEESSVSPLLFSIS